MERSASAGHAAAHAAEVHTFEGHATGCTALRGGFGAAALDEIQAILVVDFALFGVGEEFVGLGDFFEFLGGFGVVGVFVGVGF